MNLSLKVGAVVAVALIGCSVAFASGPPSNPGRSGGQTTTTSDQPGEHAALPAKAKAYGHYCQNQSKKHVAGQKGTPFSQCVTAMAKAAHGQSPVAACASLSKKHVAGEKGTPFSRCVVAAAHLHKDQHKQKS
jgi:hypothetical protein